MSQKSAHRTPPRLDSSLLLCCLLANSVHLFVRPLPATKDPKVWRNHKLYKAAYRAYRPYRHARTLRCTPHHFSIEVVGSGAGDLHDPQPRKVAPQMVSVTCEKGVSFSDPTLLTRWCTQPVPQACGTLLQLLLQPCLSQSYLQHPTMSARLQSPQHISRSPRKALSSFTPSLAVTSMLQVAQDSRSHHPLRSLNRE